MARILNIILLIIIVLIVVNTREKPVKLEMTETEKIQTAFQIINKYPDLIRQYLTHTEAVTKGPEINIKQGERK